MPVFGLSTGIVSIISYNYGADSKQRVIQTIRLSILYATAVMIAGFALFQAFPAQSCDVQCYRKYAGDWRHCPEDNQHLLYTRRLCVISGSVFQARRGMPSMLESIGRQIAALLPLAYILSKRAGSMRSGGRTRCLKSFQS